MQVGVQRLKQRKPFPKNMNQIHNIYGVAYPTVYYYAHSKLHLDSHNKDGLISKEDESLLLEIFKKRRNKRKGEV